MNLNFPVLLLNSSFEPLNVVTVKRAVRLMFSGKAIVVEAGESKIRCAGESVPLPSVVRMTYFVTRPFQKTRFTKQSVFDRDNHRCLYCGSTEKLTIDHVLPKTLGGKTTWTNVVTACQRCNSQKGGQTLKESGMKLLRIPVEPRFLSHLRKVKHEYQAVWNKYLFTGSNSDQRYIIHGMLPNEGAVA